MLAAALLHLLPSSPQPKALVLGENGPSGNCASPEMGQFQTVLTAAWTGMRFHASFPAVLTTLQSRSQVPVWDVHYS